MKISKLFYFITLLVLLMSCSSQQKLTKTPMNNYTQFRALQQKFTSTDGEIAYIDKGQGEVILLLHGVPTSSWVYREMIDGLVTKGYRVIAPDMLGYGNSANPDGYDIYAHAAHAKRLLALMESLNIKEWHHVTHDVGGLWTWELLKADKTKVKSLTLLNTIVYEEGFNPPVNMTEGFKAKTAMWAYRQWLLRPLLMNGLFKSGLKKENKLDKNEKEGYKQPLREDKTKGMYYFFTQTGKPFPDNSSLFESLNIPTCLIWGEHDKMLQIQPQQERIRKKFGIRQDNFHIIDAKHFIQEEEPALVNKYILQFLNNQ